jgi:hypothetical protein
MFKGTGAMNRKGQSLMIVLGILVIFMIFIPSMVYMVRHEALWTVQQKKTTAAFHAAEAGIDRGAWKLRETSGTWAHVLGGGSIEYYTGETVYTLYSETDTAKVIGQYKVLITTAPMLGEVLIRSVGRDVTSSEVRCIEATYARQTIDASINCDGGVSWKPHLTVHWAPLVSYTSVDLGGSSDYFPRKYSTGAITPRCSTINDPHSDGKEFWAFQDLGEPPEVDLEFYKKLARNSQIPLSTGGGTIFQGNGGTTLAIASPTGSGYFIGTQNGGKIRLDGSYTLTSSTSVIYVENGKMDFWKTSFLDLRAVIAEGDIDYNARNTVYVASVPATAATEYIKQKEVTPSYTFPGENSATYAVDHCGMHGFLYCGGTLSNSGGNDAKLVGAVKVINNITMNNFFVYYDQAVASSIKLSNAAIRQTSWREIRANW